MPSKVTLTLIYGLLVDISPLLENAEMMDDFVRRFDDFGLNFEDCMSDVHLMLCEAHSMSMEAEVIEKMLNEFEGWSDQVLKYVDDLFNDVPEKAKNKEGERARPSRKGKEKMDEFPEEKGNEETIGKKKDDDDKVFFHKFESTISLVRDPKCKDKHFYFAKHKEKFEQMKSREVMQHRTVDFEFLENHGILVHSLFQTLGLDSFCTESFHEYPSLVAYFYSNLSFPNPAIIIFSVDDRRIILSAERLAKILGVDRYNFAALGITPRYAYKFLTKDPTFS